MILAYLYKLRQNVKNFIQNDMIWIWFFSEYNMPTKILVFFTLKLSLHLAINEEMLLLHPWTAGNSAGEMHCSTPWTVPDRLSLGVQHRAARDTITLLTRVPRDTGLKNYGVKKWCLVQSIVFQVDLMWKEISIKQLCCTWAFHIRLQSWSFLWSNKNGFAFVYYKYIRQLKHLTQNGSCLARQG